MYTVFKTTDLQVCVYQMLRVASYNVSAMPDENFKQLQDVIQDPEFMYTLLCNSYICMQRHE